MPDVHSNFAYATVATAPSPASSGTSLVVSSGDGAKFPAVPFNVTIWPVGTQPSTANAEIARCTAVSTDTLTITRAQEGSSARTVVVGDQIANTITKLTLTDAETSFGGVTATTALAARGSSGLNIESKTVMPDSALVGVATDRVIAISTTLTAPRQYTMPAANAVNLGATLTVVDFGGQNGFNVVSTVAHSGDTLTGGGTVPVGTASTFVSDGTSKWTAVTFYQYPLAIGSGGTGQTTAAAVRTALSTVGPAGADTAQTSLTNPTSLTSLLGVTIPLANSSVAVGDRFHIYASGVYNNNSTATTLELQLLLGAVALYDWTTSGTLTTSANNRRWTLEVRLMVSATGASGTSRRWGQSFISAAGTAEPMTLSLGAGANGDGAIGAVAPATIDWTNPGAFDLKAKFATSAAAGTIALREFDIVKFSA